MSVAILVYQCAYLHLLTNIQTCRRTDGHIYKHTNRHLMRNTLGLQAHKGTKHSDIKERMGCCFCLPDNVTTTEYLKHVTALCFRLKMLYFVLKVQTFMWYWEYKSEHSINIGPYTWHSPLYTGKLSPIRSGSHSYMIIFHPHIEEN